MVGGGSDRGPQQASPVYMDLTVDPPPVKSDSITTRRRRPRRPAGSKQMDCLRTLVKRLLQSGGPLEGRPEGKGSEGESVVARMTRSQRKDAMHGSVMGGGKREAEICLTPRKRRHVEGNLPGSLSGDPGSRHPPQLRGKPPLGTAAALRPVMGALLASGPNRSSGSSASVAGTKRSAAVMAKWLMGESQARRSDAPGNDPIKSPATAATIVHSTGTNDGPMATLVSDGDDDLVCLSDVPASPAATAKIPSGPLSIATPPPLGRRTSRVRPQGIGQSLNGAFTEGSGMLSMDESASPPLGRRTRGRLATASTATPAAEIQPLLPRDVLQGSGVPELPLAADRESTREATAASPDVQRSQPGSTALLDHSSPEPLITPREGRRQTRLRARITLNSPLLASDHPGSPAPDGAASASAAAAGATGCGAIKGRKESVEDGFVLEGLSPAAGVSSLDQRHETTSGAREVACGGVDGDGAPSVGGAAGRAVLAQPSGSEGGEGHGGSCLEERGDAPPGSRDAGRPSVGLDPVEQVLQIMRVSAA